MARIRTVKPDFFRNEDLAEVPLTAERTFMGLITEADDKGRLRDQPAVLWGSLWALRRQTHTVENFANDLNLLAEKGLICRYVDVDGKACIHIPTFLRHQRVPKPSQPRVGECPIHDDMGNLRPQSADLDEDPGKVIEMPEARAARSS